MSDGCTYQVVEHAFIQLSFRTAAVPELVVVIVETIPVLAEFLKAVGIDVTQPGVICQLDQ
jgi:hypothetical protein